MFWFSLPFRLLRRPRLSRLILAPLAIAVLGQAILAPNDGASAPAAPRLISGGEAWQGTSPPATPLLRPRPRPPAARPERAGRGQMLTAPVTRVRDGDTIVVGATPIRIANLDCAEKGSRNGDRATQRMTELTRGAGPLTCRQEGRRSYDREVGTCALPDGRDIGEVLIREGYCERWRKR